MIEAIYFIDDQRRFQVDTSEGSYVFGPSIYTADPGQATCFVYPEGAKDKALDVLISAIIWAYAEGYR